MNDQLKAFAILALGGIAGGIIYRYVDSFNRELSPNDTNILIACIVAIVLVVIADRIISLKLSRDQIEIRLADIKKGMRETIAEVQESVPRKDDSRLEAAKALTETSHGSDNQSLVEEAEDIGKALVLLRQVMKSYRDAGGQR